MNFLPEDDQEYLQLKQIAYELKIEDLPGGGKRRGIFFPAFCFGGDLHSNDGNGLIACKSCRVLILVPDGYQETKLDSFYTQPFLVTRNGTIPDRAADRQKLFDEEWQFWSRHLSKEDWEAGSRGLETFLQYVRVALETA